MTPRKHVSIISSSFETANPPARSIKTMFLAMGTYNLASESPTEMYWYPPSSSCYFTVVSHQSWPVYNTAWTEDSFPQFPVRIWYQSFSDPKFINEAWCCLATEQVNCQLFLMPSHACNTPSSVDRCLHCDASSMSTAQLLPTYPCQNISQMLQLSKTPAIRCSASGEHALLPRWQLSQSRNCCCHNHTQDAGLLNCSLQNVRPSHQSLRQIQPAHWYWVVSRVVGQTQGLMYE